MARQLQRHPDIHLEYRVGGAAEQKTGLMMAGRLSYAATSESRYMVAA